MTSVQKELIERYRSWIIQGRSMQYMLDHGHCETIEALISYLNESELFDLFREHNKELV